jgi:hypothetical protein
VPGSRGQPDGILPGIEKIALEMLAYGRRRITAELKRRKWLRQDVLDVVLPGGPGLQGQLEQTVGLILWVFA